MPAFILAVCVSACAFAIAFVIAKAALRRYSREFDLKLRMRLEKISHPPAWLPLSGAVRHGRQTAAFVYAYEHLKIGGYELLLRTARRTGDAGTAQLCEELLGEERETAERSAGTFGSAASATLDAVSKG